jgi:hypothetical protein
LKNLSDLGSRTVRQVQQKNLFSLMVDEMNMVSQVLTLAGVSVFLGPECLMSCKQWRSFVIVREC